MVRVVELMEFYQFFFGDNLFRFIFVGCKVRGNGNFINGISIEGVVDFEILMMIVEFGGLVYYFGCIV